MYLSFSTAVLLGALYAGYALTYLSGHFKYSYAKTVFAIIPVALIAVALLVRKKEGVEPYGDFHRALNEVAGHETLTEWINVGYWTVERTFPEACEALALKVALAACPESGHVLGQSSVYFLPISTVFNAPTVTKDVGFGCGDSLLLQLQHPLLPRPKTLTGVTNMAGQHRRALERVNQVNHGRSLPVMLYHGDAIWKPTAGTPNPHPLNPVPIDAFGQFDSILALDCAYHFSTRKLFLEQCFARLLSETGRIALADMCFEPNSSFLGRHTALLWAIALSVPSANLVTLSQYRSQLECIGYDDIQIEDISAHVFPGLIAFLRSRGLLWGIFAYMLRIWWKTGGRYVLVSASKPKEGVKRSFASSN